MHGCLLMFLALSYDELSQNWQAIKRVNELYILIPMLGSLKGILEMNLSSRLSTSVGTTTSPLTSSHWFTFPRQTSENWTID